MENEAQKNYGGGASATRGYADQLLLDTKSSTKDVIDCARAIWGLSIGRPDFRAAIREGHNMLSMDMIQHASTMGLDRFFDPVIEITKQTTGILYSAVNLLAMQNPPLAKITGRGPRTFTFTLTEFALETSLISSAAFSDPFNKTLYIEP